MSPLVLGRYQLLREIASGGMATVYAARAAGAGGFQKLVAVKRMLPHMTSEPAFKDMFLDEARLTANIRSPYAVATLDLGEAEDGSLFLVMDLVIGTSLAELLRGCIQQGRVLPIPAVVEIVQQAARGLHDAHEATSPLGEPLHIVHRDVSPQNILVGIDGASRITDFGVAHALERLTKTKGRNIKGKIAYCSPEQARGDSLDARSDVFALGIVLWEALTHRRLFKGQSMSETIQALLGGDIPDPRSLRPEIPERLAAVVHTALQRDPAHRYQSALEFAEALRRAVEEHVRTEDLRDLVKLIAGDHIAELVSDIRAAIESSSGPTSHTWDDSPTEIDRSHLATRDLSPSQAETLDRLKKTGQFLATPPSPATLAAFTPSPKAPALAADFSSSFEGPSGLKAPSGVTTPLTPALPVTATTQAPAQPPPARRRGALVLLLVCVAAALTAPLLYMLLKPSASETDELAGATIGGMAGPQSEVIPTTPIAPAPPLGLATPRLADATTLSPGFEPRLWSAKGLAGGTKDAQELSTECVGYMAERPQHVVFLGANFPRLRVFVHSELNTSLVVRSPSGATYCNDDGQGLNPIVDQEFPAGRYEIFIASLVESQRPEYTLGISEHDEFSPRSFEPEVETPTSIPSTMSAREPGPRRSPRMSPHNSMRGGNAVLDPWAESRIEDPHQEARPTGMERPRAPILR